MKPFIWKFLICLVPCLLAGWATTDATVKYYNGDAGGFKFGVDLVGGTIVVYEIDLRKNQQDAENKFDPVRDIAVLAESLKRRIDPNDLYNIIIRPAGGEGRIEIILPTGGKRRAEKADKTWNDLLEKLKGEFFKGDDAKLEVGRGKILELADQIQSHQSESLWKKQLFTDKDAWKRLQDRALDDWAYIDLNPDYKKELLAIQPGDLTPEVAKPKVVNFTDFMLAKLQNTQYATSRKAIQAFIKRQAWEETMTRARLKWTYLENYKEDMERINPDSVDQLTTFILAKGSVIGQSALSLLQPLVGDNLKKVFLDDPADPDSKEIRDFIDEHYGSSVQRILDRINVLTKKKDGENKDLSVEEVGRIKNLVQQVGSLEFRILANANDDKAAIDDMKKMINLDRAADAELKETREKGLPPPTLRDGKEPRRYTIVTARTEKSTVTYSWVELGRQERKALNLDNAARTDSSRSVAWHKAAGARDRVAELPDLGGETSMLQGALFFSRKCEDRNLPDDERRKKEFEYFVLTRDPEFDPTDPNRRTPKIDGSYLTNAYGAPGQDLRPTVHFAFNTAGGDLFGNITRKNVSEGAGGPKGTQKLRHLAIILDGAVMSAPTINSEIRQQGQISGNFTQKEVDSLVNILRAGRLPATLNPLPVSESTIAATLGEDTIRSGVLAILLAFGAVLAFMVVYYRFAGLVASVALTANLLLTVGFMVAVQATFTLSGLAGIVLTLGMAVDANVLIYERLREERERGASLLQAIRNGYDRALPTIIDTHLSSIFTAIVLYVVGNDNLKGFAVSMTVGLIISLFTSLYMTRVMFDFWQSKGWLTKLTMMRLFAKPDIDFMSIRYVMFAITLGLSILGLALFIGRIPNDLNIDFVGGTAYGGKLTKGLLIETLRPMVDEKHQKKVLGGVIVTEVPQTDGRGYDLKFPNGDNKTHTVSFSKVPDGRTPEERIANVTNRASHLPEPSVELLYNTTKDEVILKEQLDGKSRNFVIRTTEKEPDLVQTCLDQLLREGSEQLLAKVYVHADKMENREMRLHFFAKEEDAGEKKLETATAAPSFLKSLLNRELRRQFASVLTDDKVPLPFLYEIIAEGSSDSDGKFKVMKVVFGPELKDEDIGKVEAAIVATVNAFSARPAPDRLENFDSALANETRLRAMWAVLASWTAILMYLWFRFGNWTFGLAAVLCLIHDLFFTLGAIAACYFVHGTFVGDLLKIDDFKLDLASVAALLTLVGYSVNDTIVVFDRIREVRGKNSDLTPKMINDSINQTLSRTVLASLTVWLVVVVLYWFGGPGVHLFAFVMVIGVLVGTYSSIYIASPLLLMFGEGKHDEPAQQIAKQPAPQGAAV
ncbi:MAG: protein translocase subunit SecD [Gemmataceae bacterium]|nr:protein translocase subunit SecD [Gemmataceae bacterium]